ncbi:hypothetical protein LTR24_010281 [Lithohypha guttulata]|uniref:Ankyrin n=1 Tax=Lithohypha guttulata TaxID=1690604 RepID=A0ABR0JUF3_9EURO|nr:hypothetical protein LTR24_010281 [Lithohypha guttulata]
MASNFDKARIMASSLVYLALPTGADPNIPTPITNDYPVVLALAQDRPDVLSILLSKYFKHLHPSPSPNGTITTTDIVNPTSADAPGLNWTGSRPNRLAGNTHLPRDTLTYLMAAVLKGSTGCVKALLGADADVNIRAHGYRTVLHFIASAQTNNYVEMTWVIARRGADVFADEGVQYFTPLHMAVYRKDTRLLEALLSSMVFRAEYGHRKRDTRVYGCGMSPLDLAKRMGWHRGVEVFTKAWESVRVGNERVYREDG